MKNKKTLYIILSVVALCIVGYVVSRVIDWPIDYSNSSGNISKSAKFSRKTADGGISNMQELLLNDKNFKDGVVVSYVVMSNRAKEFSALVDASEEVAGNIPEFKSVLKDMAKSKKMAKNVCEALDAAAEDLNAVLGGEEAENLAQSTADAALAYTTMQKQNGLANRFIETADEYLANNEGSDALKFIRDQWVEYQKATAFLEGDKDAAAELEKKGYILTSEQSVAALGFFTQSFQQVVVSNTEINEFMGLSPVIRISGVAGAVNQNLVVNQNEVANQNLVVNQNEVANQNLVVNQNEVANQNLVVNQNEVANQNLVVNQNEVANQNLVVNQNEVANQNLVMNLSQTIVGFGANLNNIGTVFEGAVGALNNSFGASFNTLVRGIATDDLNTVGAVYQFDN